MILASVGIALGLVGILTGNFILILAAAAIVTVSVIAF